MARIESDIKIFTPTMYNSEHDQSCDQDFTT